ncbi:MAG: arginine--tRNA ligase [Verrucomicrobia bacterium]|nr:arginine--tRNA ligase [Verrucomicrobiota bacterium]
MLHKQIELKLQAAVLAALPDADVSAVLVRPCDPKFGDYQSNALMSLAKQRKLNPRQLATDTLAKLDVSEWCEKVEIVGAGFINFRLKPAALAQTLEAAARGEHLFFDKAAQPKTAVIDFSSPNVAKPMHVGHIRSTILGDCLTRTLRLLGHRVVADNHIGDWGTQFGMLLLGWKTILDQSALKTDAIAELERVYKTINERCKADPQNLELAKQELVKLQGGDAENLRIWHEMIRLSQVQFDTIYGRLGVKFDVTLGESFYNPKLKPLVEELLAKGIARESEGAIIIAFDDVPALKEQPTLIRKSDGGFNYSTTDLATLAHRLQTWSPDEIIYVTDGRQQLHFTQVFTAFRKWHGESKAKLAHVWFGSILGEDGKPFKTRSGETVKLADLLDEAEERAFKLVSEKSGDLPEAQRKEIARVTGLGAVKYADLLPNRQSDYIFSWDKMLALAGNTAVYVQYQFTRANKVVRDGAPTLGLQPSAIRLTEPAESALAKFTSFYENCPVLKADDAATRASRLALCDLTARVLKQGLATLGIETVEQM